jgi:hypothetical protein
VERGVYWVNFTRSLKYPFQDSDWLTKLIVGGLLNLVPVANLLSAGFSLEAMRMGTQGHEKLPEWENWLDKFVLGLMGAIISVIYSLIPIILMTAGGLGSDGATGAGLLLGTMALFLVAFLMPMIMANYVARQQFGAAFSLGEVFDHLKVVLGDFIVAWVLAIVIAFFMFLVMFIPIVGWIIALFAGFYIQVVFANIFGQLYYQGSLPAEEN